MSWPARSCVLLSAYHTTAADQKHLQRITAMPDAAPNLPPVRVRFGGLAFDQVRVAQTVALMAARPADAQFAYFCTPNAEHIYWRWHTPDYTGVIDRAWLSTCDSRILRRIAAWSGVALEFTPGAYVVPPLFADGIIRPDDPITLIGSTAPVREMLMQRYGLTRVAQHIPPMGFIDDAGAVRAAIAFVVANPGRFVFIAMGPPHSDRLAGLIQEAGAATGIGLCVGSAINTLLGLVPVAPDWMENNGLVWLFRLWREPRRLWRRYLGRSLAGCVLAMLDVAHRRLGVREQK